MLHRPPTTLPDPYIPENTTFLLFLPNLIDMSYQQIGIKWLDRRSRTNETVRYNAFYLPGRRDSGLLRNLGQLPNQGSTSEGAANDA